MRPARPNRLVIAWFDAWSRRAMRAAFANVHLYPETPGEWERPFDASVSRLYVANHSSFWDGIVLRHLIRAHRRQPFHCMVDAVQVAAHPFFLRVGAFSVDRASPRDGLRAVAHAARCLNDAPSALLVFPQGKILANDARPLAFESGVARIIEGAPGVRVIPVAMRYEFWLEQRAEAMVWLGAERGFAGRTRTEIVTDLERAITDGSEQLKARGRAFEPAPHILLRGEVSISLWQERFGVGRRRGDPST